MSDELVAALAGTLNSRIDDLTTRVERLEATLDEIRTFLQVLVTETDDERPAYKAGS